MSAWTIGIARQVVLTAILHCLSSATATETAVPVEVIGESLLLHRDICRKHIVTGAVLLKALDGRRVRNVTICNAVVDDSGWRVVANADPCMLVLQDVNLEDGDLALILASSQCAYLDITNSFVTSAAIPSIARSTGLKEIVITGSGIGLNEAAVLHRLRPDLRIRLDGTLLLHKKAKQATKNAPEQTSDKDGVPRHKPEDPCECK